MEYRAQFQHRPFSRSLVQPRARRRIIIELDRRDKLHLGCRATRRISGIVVPVERFRPIYEGNEVLSAAMGDRTGMNSSTPTGITSTAVAAAIGFLRTRIIRQTNENESYATYSAVAPRQSRLQAQIWASNTHTAVPFEASVVRYVLSPENGNPVPYRYRTSGVYRAMTTWGITYHITQSPLTEAELNEKGGHDEGLPHQHAISAAHIAEQSRARLVNGPSDIAAMLAAGKQQFSSKKRSSTPES